MIPMKTPELSTEEGNAPSLHVQSLGKRGLPKSREKKHKRANFVLVGENVQGIARRPGA
jgi:hypothetical protein